MAAERSTTQTHAENPNQQHYDWEYYKQLLPSITGEVLDLGAGAGMFIKEYARKEEVTSIIAVDKYIDELPTHIEKLTAVQAILPDFQIDKKFDTIVSTEFVEHITREEFEPFLENVKKHLKETGVFIGSTPNKISQTTNPYHLYEYTLSELLGIMKNYFTEVEAWDNSQNCTLWLAKL